ncbi:MAG: DUF86 domain-containing protein [Candidatus Neomarinimicrobiota bacterium]
MMAKRVYSDYLRDIQEAAEKAQQFIEGLDFEDFAKDEKTVFATVRALEIIGEAAKHVPEEVRRQYPDIPWRDMAGMRDKVIHEYFGVNLRRVFDTVHQELPHIHDAFVRILKEIEKGSDE